MLRLQIASQGPMLFALYMVDLSRALAASNHGVTLYSVCVSALFFAKLGTALKEIEDGSR